MELRNQPCYDKEGKMIGWLSRSVCVVGFTFAKNAFGDWCVLVSQRGEDTPDPEFRGCWNAVCGYLDYGETCMQAIAREYKEELGFDITPFNTVLWKIIDDPEKDKRQNVSFRYVTIIEDKKVEEMSEFSKEGNEGKEVGDIRWMPLSDVCINKWAFNHDDVILNVRSEFDKLKQ